MDRNDQRIGLLAFLALLGAAGTGVALARSAGSASGIAGAALLGVGVLVALASYFQMRLAAREQLEDLEADELKRKTGERPALFADADLELRPARRAREQFERVLVPVFTALLVLLEAGAAVWLWRFVQKASPARADAATLT